MENGVDHLASTVAAHLSEWDTPAFVELAVFGSQNAPAIAEAIDAFCRQHLKTVVAKGLFHQSSIGCVTGVVLEDGRSVVIKAHQPESTRVFLTEVVRVQSFLADKGLFATKVLTGPAPLGEGFAIVEAYADTRATANAHDPVIRRALARALRAIISACEPLVPSTVLPPFFLPPPEGALWPKPHSKLFDFDATAAGAAWIDDVAALARDRMSAAGRRVIGHGDWRQEHVRFFNTQPVVAFDWDSLRCDFEPVLVGVNAHAFCADWSLTGHKQAPTLDEARAFRSEYEEARGSAFSAEERALCAAAFAYACAYTARCGHAEGKDERHIEGTFQHLVWTQQANLLDL